MDIRRTVLWMIFSLSLLLLWNNWQVHNGKPSLFGASSTATQTATPTQATTAVADPSIPSAAPAATAAPATDNTVPGSEPQAAAGTSEKVQVKKIGRAHVCTPVTNAHHVCRLLLEENNHKQRMPL